VATEFEFCLLGPLLVRRCGVVTPVTRGKERAVLAALLLGAGRVVSLDELAETLWGSSPPRSARVTLQNYVRRLRRALADTDGSRISTLPHGYLISVAASELDASKFEALQDAARDAAREGAWDQAAAQLRAALSLWRGEPLADVPSELLAQRVVPRLTEMRLQAVEARINADLHLGRHGEVIGELRQLVSVHPLRERLHALLMLALYRDGQQAEALAAYQRARRVLIDELGAEPGLELRRLEHQILTADPALETLPPLPADSEPEPARAGSGPGDAGAGGGPRAPGLSPAAGAAVPRLLPAPVAHFAGRRSELKTLSRLLDQAGAQAQGTVVISAIGGTAGVGKTALAVHWAHRVAGLFPDGQLYVNLRGYDPGQPMPAAEALAGFLRTLGLPGPQIPAELAERAAAYRSLLADRRVLIVLDNARDAEQVRPLLPGEPGCLVVVTSRDMLTGLVARDGADRVLLDVLPPADAMALLRALIGPRVDRKPEAAVRIAGLCCCLPLALRVAAELATARPRVPLAVLADELEQQQHRLDLLEAGGDSATAIRQVFSWSLRHLDPATVSAFGLAAQHPGPDLDAWALAALAGCSHEQADPMLRELARAHLIQAVGASRYGMHDLLRAFGRELASSDAGGIDAHAALTGLLVYLQHAAAAAMDILFPAEAGQRPRPLLTADPLPPFTGEAQARAWLDAERATLVAATVQAADKGWHAHAINLAGITHRYLTVGGYYAEAVTVQQSALHAAELAGDLDAEADALLNLGDVRQRQSQHEDALRCLERAHELTRLTGDQAAEYRVLSGLAMINYLQGRYRQAVGNYQQILDLCQSAGSQRQQIRALLGLGTIALLTGRYQQADRQLRQAADLCGVIGERVYLANALANLGDLHLRQGSYQEAADHLERSAAICRDSGDHVSATYAACYLARTAVRQGQYHPAEKRLRAALARFRASGNRHGETQAIACLSELELRCGRYRRARKNLEQALAICDETGDLADRAEALNLLGEVLLATGDAAQARVRHHDALALASQLEDPYQQAHAHRGLGNAEAALGNHTQAGRHFEQALARYTELGTPEAGQIRTQLADKTR
jgi:DNA-binding SARP family transcriptional activator/predicted negative regulator of RcsB-dependent stress response